jgi:hypothetical protein
MHGTRMGVVVAGSYQHVKKGLPYGRCYERNFAEKLGRDLGEMAENTAVIPGRER